MEREKNTDECGIMRVKFFSVIVTIAYIRPAIAASRKSHRSSSNESRQVSIRTRGVKTGWC